MPFLCLFEYMMKLPKLHILVISTLLISAFGFPLNHEHDTRLLRQISIECLHSSKVFQDAKTYRTWSKSEKVKSEYSFNYCLCALATIHSSTFKNSYHNFYVAFIGIKDLILKQQLLFLNYTSESCLG